MKLPKFLTVGFAMLSELNSAASIASSSKASTVGTVVSNQNEKQFSPLRLQQGIIPPIVTPLVDNDTIDVIGMERLMDHVLSQGVSGVFCLGTTGEFAALSAELRAKFIRHCCEMVQERRDDTPVLVGITDMSLSTTIELAKLAQTAGASAVVLTTPYYFPLESAEIVRWVESVLDAIELPVMLYNMPGLTDVWYDIETLKELSKYQQIAGIKDSSGDLEYFDQVVQLKKQLRPDWKIMIGPEHLLVDAIRLGGDGGVNGGANIYPELFVNLFQAAMDNHTDQVDALSQKVTALQAIYQVGTPGFRHAVATKSALSVKGICSDVMAAPFQPFNTQEKAEVEAILKEVESISIE